MSERKNSDAVRLGKLRAASMTDEEWKEHGRTYGPAGGAARAAALTPERRAEIARAAAAARWGDKSKAPAKKVARKAAKKKA